MAFEVEGVVMLFEVREVGEVIVGVGEGRARKRATLDASSRARAVSMSPNTAAELAAAITLACQRFISADDMWAASRRVMGRSPTRS